MTSRRDQAGSIALAVLIVMAASLLANAWLYSEWRAEHDKLTTAEANLSQANSATKACNDSIGELERQAKYRDAENATLRKQAADRRRSQEQLAQQILATPATTPGDDCKSARDRVANWLKGRKP